MFAEFTSSETNEYSSVRRGGIASILSEAEEQSGRYLRRDRVPRDHNDKNVRRRELGGHHVPAIHRVAAFTGTAPFRWRASGSAVAARTETAYRLEASNCSVSLQRLETIEPMLIRDAAVDFALAHAP
jgi:hypothetical protein